MKKSDQDTIMKFPCQFPIKVMGMASDDFDTMVVEIIKKHVTELPKGRSKKST